MAVTILFDDAFYGEADLKFPIVLCGILKGVTEQRPVGSNNFRRPPETGVHYRCRLGCGLLAVGARDALLKLIERKFAFGLAAQVEGSYYASELSH